MSLSRDVHNNKGFTLLEVLIAVIILGLAYVAVLQSFSFSMCNIARIEDEFGADFSESCRFLAEARYEGGAAGDEKRSGQDYITGHKYRLIKVTSEDGELITLRLDRQ
ncbi:MAG: prepilin-type N-terminal cleavage/methylation domain-containing protein [Desulfobia sp.]